MAVLKYKNSQGQFVSLTNYTVQPITPVQTTGDSMSDVMSQKAVTDGLAAKVNNSELDEKIASAITSDSSVSGAVENIVDEKLASYSSATEINNALEGKADKVHTHVVADITDFNEGIASAITNDASVSGAINTVVSESIVNNETVSAAVETVISAFTENNLDDRYAFKEHTHKASAITDFDSAVEGVVATSTTITDRIETVVASAITNNESVSASVESVISAFTDNTLDNRYAAKSHTHNTDEINGFDDAIANAIESNDAVISAVTKILSSDSGITEVINNVVSGQVDSAVSGKVNTSVFNEFSSTTETALGKKFEGVNYVKNDNKIYFYNNASNTGTALASIDTSDFIVDGMIESVELESKSGSTYLVITWNTAAGSTVTELNIGDIFEADNYYTTGETDTKFLAKEDADSVIASAITNNNTVKNDVISAVTTSTEFTTLSGNVDSISGTVTAHTANTEIHVTSADKVAWNAKSDFSGSYNDLTDTPTIPTSASQLTNDAGYITISALNGYATEEYVQSAITEASGVTPTTVQTMIDESISGKSDVGHTHEISGVTGLQTALDGKASSSHTHNASAITDFSDAVASAITNSTDVANAVNSAITSNTVVQNITGDVQTLSGKVETISGDVITLSGSVSGATAMADFLSGHNTVNTLANIPTTKRLVIATITSSTNVLSLSGHTLQDGYEIHIIVKNNGSADATVTLPSSGGYIAVGDAITIAANSTGEINVISDGTNLYVRGA